MFAVLGAVLVATGLVIGLWLPGPFAMGGWIGAAVFVAFAFVGRALVDRESAARAGLLVPEEGF